MKRAEALWQVVILCLVFLSVVGVYGMLAHVLQRRWGSGQIPLFASPAEVSEVVQIVAPFDGEVMQRGTPVVVRALLTEGGFVQAELRVDGAGRGIEVNPDPPAVPWVVEWIWQEAGEGTHLLTAQARRQEGGWEASAPVTVTVVPTGTLAFVSNRNGAYAIYVLQTDGRDLNRLTVGPGDAQQPAWRGDGVLTYVAEATGGRAMIQALEARAEAGVDLFAGRDPAWSPRDGYLAFARAVEGVSQVFTVAAGKDLPIQLTEEESYAGQPTWSPDGSRVAYVAERERNWDIWVAMVDGGEPRRVTEDPAMDWAPAWSPDGSQLAFVSNRGGSHQIYSMRPDGESLRCLTDFAQGAELPSWSPDGYWLAFVAYSGEGTGVNAREIYLMRADGQDQVRLTRNDFDDSEPDWAWGP